MNTARSMLVVLAVALLYLAPAMVRGGVLLPLDILHQLGPFSASIPPPLSGVANPHLSDLVTMIYPWIDLFRSGGEAVPLWNPYSFCGSPLAASAQTGLLFPLQWLYKVLPIGPASIAVAAGKLMLAGSGALLYFRAIGLLPFAALFGAVVTMLGGQLVVWLGYPGAFPLAVMPWVFWALERYLASPTARRAAALAAAYGLLFLASQPQFGFVVALGSALYFAAHAGFRGGGRLRLYLGFGAAAAIGFCLAAPQILPFLEYLGESAAGRLRAGFGWKQYPWFTAVSWLVPRFFGDPREENFWGFSSLLGEAAYASAVAVPLAAVGAAPALRSRPGRAILAVAAAAALGLYAPPAQRLYQAVPLLGSIDNNKLLVLVGFALTVLAAFGFDALARASGARRPFVLYQAAALAAVVFGATVVLRFQEAIRDLRLERFETREAAWAAAALASASLVVAAWGRRVPPGAAAALLIALATADVFRVWLGYHPSFPEEYLRPRSASVEFLQERLEGGRFLGLNGFLPPETSILYRLHDARGIEGLTPFRHYRLFGRIDSTMHDLEAHLPIPPPSKRWEHSTLFYRSLSRLLAAASPAARAALRELDYWNTEISRIERPGLLSVMGVRYVLAPVGEPLPRAAGLRLVHSSDAEVWENPSALPRAFVSTRPAFVASEEAALAAISDPAFRFDSTAVIRGDAPPPAGAGRIVPARIERERPHAVEVRADSAEGGWLVLSDLFYPGWKATVDGAPAEILQANYLFRAVKVAPGPHTVRFEYRPASFYVGLALAAAAVAALALAGVVRRRAAVP